MISRYHHSNESSLSSFPSLPKAGVDISSIEENTAAFRRQAQQSYLRRTVNMVKMGAESLRLTIWKHHLRSHKKKQISQRISVNQLRSVMARWGNDLVRMCLAQWSFETQIHAKEAITKKVGGWVGGERGFESNRPSLEPNYRSLPPRLGISSLNSVTICIKAL